MKPERKNKATKESYIYSILILVILMIPIIYLLIRPERLHKPGDCFEWREGYGYVQIFEVVNTRKGILYRYNFISKDESKTLERPAYKHFDELYEKSSCDEFNQIKIDYEIYKVKERLDKLKKK